MQVFFFLLVTLRSFDLSVEQQRQEDRVFFPGFCKHLNLLIFPNPVSGKEASTTLYLAQKNLLEVGQLCSFGSAMLIFVK